MVKVLTLKFLSVGLKARDELIMSHELKGEITGAEEDSLQDSEIFYDIVGGRGILL